MKRYIFPLLFCASQLNAQPVLVSDIWPGANGSKPYGLTDFNGKLAFTANDGTHSAGLWLAGAGSLHLLDFRTAPHEGLSFRPYKKCVVNNQLYFSAIAYQNDLELFRIDDRNNVQIVFDLPGPNAAYPANLCTANNDVYFSGNDGNYERKLWRYSPFYNTTSLIENIDPSFHTDGEIAQLTSINNILYFSSYFLEDGNLIPEAFRYEPSTKTLTRTGNILAKYYPEQFIELNNQIYFVNNTESGSKLWNWDGVHQPVEISSFTDISALIVFQGKLFFEARYHNNAPCNLFSFDPTNNTIQLIPTTMSFNGIMQSQMIIYNSNLFFCADKVLWRYDGLNKPIPIFDPRIKFDGEEICLSNGILYITGASDAVGEELYAYYEAPTSVNTIVQQTPINIYPNPTTSSWNFDLSSLKEHDLQLIITDVTGRVVSKQQVNNDKKVSATAPVPGSYLYYITDNAGIAIQSGNLQQL